MRETTFTPPESGTKLTMVDGRIVPTDEPIIPYIVGDGIGADITPVMLFVVDAAVARVYAGKRKIHWWQLPAGQVAADEFGKSLPTETVEAIKEYRVAIKGPLTTPVGKGIRSLNVELRQSLDLYACVRPVRWYPGVPSPVKRAEDLDIVIFRENMEDLYMGIEFEAQSEGAHKVIDLVNELRVGHPPISGDLSIGLKPFSKYGTERIARGAIDYAIAKGLPSITIVHKGNIMKYTEGAFRQWAYDFYKREYRDAVVTEKEMKAGASAEGKIIVKDQITDAMFHELLLHPEEHSIIVTSNLNGDYLSDAAAAQVGGLGFAPGANFAEDKAIFEATHGTAPSLAGKNKANPGSIILSACMMLDYIGWPEAAEAIQKAISSTVLNGKVTFDLAMSLPEATELGTSEFGDAIVENLE